MSAETLEAETLEAEWAEYTKTYKNVFCDPGAVPASLDDRYCEGFSPSRIHDAMCTSIQCQSLRPKTAKLFKRSGVEAYPKTLAFASSKFPNVMAAYGKVASEMGYEEFLDVKEEFHICGRHGKIPFFKFPVKYLCEITPEIEGVWYDENRDALLAVKVDIPEISEGSSTKTLEIIKTISDLISELPRIEKTAIDLALQPFYRGVVTTNHQLSEFDEDEKERDSVVQNELTTAVSELTTFLAGEDSKEKGDAVIQHGSPVAEQTKQVEVTQKNLPDIEPIARVTSDPA